MRVRNHQNLTITKFFKSLKHIFSTITIPNLNYSILVIDIFNLLKCVRCGSENVFDKQFHLKLEDSIMVPVARGVRITGKRLHIDLSVCKNCYDGFHKANNLMQLSMALSVLGMCLIIPGLFFLFGKNPISILFFIPLPTGIILRIKNRFSEFFPGKFFSFKYSIFRLKPLTAPDWIRYEDWVISVLQEKGHIEILEKEEEKEDCPNCNLARKINQSKCPWCGKNL